MAENRISPWSRCHSCTHGGPGGGSEDDPPPGLHELGGDGGRGLYPPSAELVLRRGQSADTNVSSARAVANGKRQSSASLTTARRRRWTADFVSGGRAFAASSARDADGWRRRSSATSTSSAGSASRAIARIASSWRCAAWAPRP